ncbi:MAG: beta strand repeat-containing protein, partial [bacterium]
MNRVSLISRLISAFRVKAVKANKARRSHRILKDALLDLLEERQLLATTSFSSGLLTVNLDAIGEIFTLTNDGASITLSSTGSITGAGSSFTSANVTGIRVTDSGSLSGQSVNFGVGSAFSLSQGLSVSGVESVLVNTNLNATGSANITMTGANIIQTAGSLTTAGGPISLAATADIVITQPILTNGGVQTLSADSDGDGSGNLSLNFSIAQLTDPNPNPGNQFGWTVLVLTSGNVVVTSPYDDAGGTNAGAVYLFNGFSGQLISTLKGTSANDNVGSDGVTALTNGNYVVISRIWDNGSASNAGAVTWGSGTTGVSGNVSSTNSLVGTSTGDQVGSGGVTALSNGNYVVRSLNWDNGSATDAGAVTWGSGTTGVSGNVSSTNSLVGTTANDYVGLGDVTTLSNGNYVVISIHWKNGSVSNAGAVTWGNGTTGITGNVSSTNSLVGTRSNDQVGSGGVTALTNGNYVVISRFWDNGLVGDAGAVTWGSGTSGVSGNVSSTNSLVGTSANDRVGSSGVTALTNGNYVVISPNWDNGNVTNAGAVTWGSGTTGITGNVSLTNSLVGTSANDNVGSGGVTALSNGNYIVRSSIWDNGSVADAGAVTWGSGTTGVSGNVSSTNSLVGTSENDYVGLGGVTALTNGNYVVRSSNWKNGSVSNAGAVTWGSGTSGVSGNVSSTNSLVGTSTGDQVGY